MIYDVTEVKDLGGSYRAISVGKSDMAFIEPGRNHIKISALCAEKIREELKKGSEVLIPKGVEREIIPMDLIINETDPLTVAKGVAIAKIRSKVDGHMAAFSALEFYRFFVIHMRLLDRGFFITDENREEQYLKIIDTENDQLISELETYLELRDRASSVSWVYTKYEDSSRAIESATAGKEINRAVSDFFESIENPK